MRSHRSLLPAALVVILALVAVASLGVGTSAAATDHGAAHTDTLESDCLDITSHDLGAYLAEERADDENDSEDAQSWLCVVYADSGDSTTESETGAESDASADTDEDVSDEIDTKPVGIVLVEDLPTDDVTDAAAAEELAVAGVAGDDQEDANSQAVTPVGSVWVTQPGGDSGDGPSAAGIVDSVIGDSDDDPQTGPEIVDAGTSDANGDGQLTGSDLISRASGSPNGEDVVTGSDLIAESQNGIGEDDRTTAGDLVENSGAGTAGDGSPTIEDVIGGSGSSDDGHGGEIDIFDGAGESGSNDAYGQDEESKEAANSRLESYLSSQGKLMDDDITAGDYVETAAVGTVCTAACGYAFGNPLVAGGCGVACSLGHLGVKDVADLEAENTQNQEDSDVDESEEDSNVDESEEEGSSTEMCAASGAECESEDSGDQERSSEQDDEEQSSDETDEEVGVCEGNGGACTGTEESQSDEYDDEDGGESSGQDGEETGGQCTNSACSEGNDVDTEDDESDSDSESGSDSGADGSSDSAGDESSETDSESIPSRCGASGGCGGDISDEEYEDLTGMSVSPPDSQDEGTSGCVNNGPHCHASNDDVDADDVNDAKGGATPDCMREHGCSQHANGDFDDGKGQATPDCMNQHHCNDDSPEDVDTGAKPGTGPGDAMGESDAMVAGNSTGVIASQEAAPGEVGGNSIVSSAAVGELTSSDESEDHTSSGESSLNNSSSDDDAGIGELSG